MISVTVITICQYYTLSTLRKDTNGRRLLTNNIYMWMTVHKIQLALARMQLSLPNQAHPPSVKGCRMQALSACPSMFDKQTVTQCSVVLST